MSDELPPPNQTPPPHEFSMEEAGDTQEVSPSFFTEMFGGTAFEMVEKDIADAEQKEQAGIQRNEDGSLTFASEKLDEKEQEVIDEYLAHFEEDGFGETGLGWYFAEEDPEFRQKLAEALRARKDALGGNDETLKRLNLDENLKQGLGFFRDLAKRRQMKEVLDKQFGQLPLSKFFDQNGEEIPAEDIDYAMMSTSHGPELLVTCKDENRRITKIATHGAEEMKGKFGITAVKKNVDSAPTEAGDQTHFEIEIERGESTIQPIFDRVRVLCAPMDLDTKIDEFLEEQEKKKKQQQQAQASQPPTSTYTPPPPSAPSTPRYSQPTTYVRSG